MKIYKLNNGNIIPALGLGTFLSQNNEAYKAVKYAIEVGYRHIDCAYFYNNEEEVGRAINDAINSGTVRREDLFITSKLWNTFHKFENVKPALEKSLKLLNLSYLDLYLIHWPVASKTPLPSSANELIPLTEQPLTETWEAMETLVDDGLVKNIGVSNFSIKKLKEINQSARIKPTVNQIELHPYLQQHKLLNYCKENNIILTAYSPLGSSKSKGNLLKNAVLNSIANKHKVTPAQVILAWGLSLNISLIPKSVTPERILKNFEAQTISLDPDDFNKIKELDQHLRYIDGMLFTLKDSTYTSENLWDEEVHVFA